jgi:NitT/TauT family transport system substrate-binding protein
VTPTKLVVGSATSRASVRQFYLAAARPATTPRPASTSFPEQDRPDLDPARRRRRHRPRDRRRHERHARRQQRHPDPLHRDDLRQFPNILFAKASSGITKAADLKGRKIGTPGRFGSGWIFLQALLRTGGLTLDDVEIVEYPDFTQRAAVEQGAVDAATGFSNNEPVVMERGGTKAVVLHIDDAIPLPGPGLIAGTKTIDAKHNPITAFVAATLRAMNEIKANPAVGLDAAIRAVPELAGDREGQAAVLAATIDSWTGRLQGTQGLGAIDKDGWQASVGLMNDLKLLPKPVAPDDLVRTDLLPPGD